VSTDTKSGTLQTGWFADECLASIQHGVSDPPGVCRIEFQMRRELAQQNVSKLRPNLEQSRHCFNGSPTRVERHANTLTALAATDRLA
jgi:hypothetical protein